MCDCQGLVRVGPRDYRVVRQLGLEYSVERGGLAADPRTGGAIWLGPTGVFGEEDSARAD